MDFLLVSLTVKAIGLLGLIVGMVAVALLVAKYAPRKSDETYVGGDTPVGVVSRDPAHVPQPDEQWDTLQPTGRFGDVSPVATPTIPGLGIAPELIGDRGVAAREMFAGLPNDKLETVEATTQNTLSAQRGVYSLSEHSETAPPVYSQQQTGEPVTGWGADGPVPTDGTWGSGIANIPENGNPVGNVGYSQFDVAPVSTPTTSPPHMPHDMYPLEEEAPTVPAVLPLPSEFSEPVVEHDVPMPRPPQGIRHYPTPAKEESIDEDMPPMPPLFNPR